MKQTILFLCTGNSCRSQMAEAWARHFHGDRWDIYSAGIECHGMNPMAVKVLENEGLDLSGHSSKTLAAIEGIEFDWVITVCGHADESCPTFPQKTLKIHAPFEDPPKLALGLSDEQEIYKVYHRVSEQIRDYIQSLRLGA